MMEDRNKVLSLIGFSARANKLLKGTSKVTRALDMGKGELLIIADDIKNNTKEKLIFKTSLKNINYIIFSNIEELSKITGSENVGVYMVIDKNFSTPIIKYLGELE